jgi:hypothetical protein
MPKRSRTSKPDVNQMAVNLIDAISGELRVEDPETEKNPATVARGRLGGLKGGKVRTKRLSKKMRTEIARKAVASSWKRR